MWLLSPERRRGDDGEIEHEQREEKSERPRQKVEREGGASEQKATIERESAFSMPREV